MHQNFDQWNLFMLISLIILFVNDLYKDNNYLYKDNHVGCLSTNFLF